MPRPTVCAALIVKNESAVIERCLTAARPVIDSYLVVDTGSTDDTVERIPRTLPDTPGEVARRPWRDFGSNRSELVSLAADRADWLLLLDVVGGSVAYTMPYLVRANVPWRYEGVTHEYLTTDREPRRAPLPGLRVRHHADGGSRADKFERDRDLLTERLREAPDDARSTFYLAQTHADLGDRTRAAEQRPEAGCSPIALTRSETRRGSATATRTGRRRTGRGEGTGNA